VAGRSQCSVQTDGSARKGSRQCEPSQRSMFISLAWLVKPTSVNPMLVQTGLGMNSPPRDVRAPIQGR